MAVALDALRESIERHNDTFETLLTLIPARFYISIEPDEMSSKYMKNKRKREAPKQAVKEASKKARHDKLDPDNQKTVVDLQRESAAARRAELSNKSKGKAPQVQRDDIDNYEEDVGDESASEHDGNAASSAKQSAAPVPMPSSGSISELRARLHARMEALRRGRGGASFTHADAYVIPDSKDALLEERRLKRAGLREKRRQGIKEKKREEAAKTAKKDKHDASKKNNKVELLVPDPGPSRLSQSEAFAAVTFSRLTNTPGHLSGKHKKLVTSSDPHVALAQLEARSAKLAQLPPEKRAELEERDRLAKAEIRASGGKVYDDVSRLKKAIKRQDAQKLKSKKNWAEKKETLEKSQAVKQKKRTDNIAMRNERRKEKLKGIKPAKSKSRPGFEGRSFKKPSHSSKSGPTSKGK